MADDGDEEVGGDDDVPPLTADQAERVRAQMADTERNRRKWAGEPSRYEWWNGNDRFEILLNIYQPSGCEWELCVNGEAIRHFGDPADAMLAVHHRQTGHARWDRSTATPLPDERDWNSS